MFANTNGISCMFSFRRRSAFVALHHVDSSPISLSVSSLSYSSKSFEPFAAAKTMPQAITGLVRGLISGEAGYFGRTIGGGGTYSGSSSALKEGREVSRRFKRMFAASIVVGEGGERRSLVDGIRRIIFGRFGCVHVSSSSALCFLSELDFGGTVAVPWPERPPSRWASQRT